MARTSKSSPLSKERIIKAAYKLAIKDPTTTLSMRKIAAKLNVTPMAIYNYIEDKDDLTSAVVDTHLKKSNLIPTDIDPDSHWREWIKDSFLRLRNAFN